MTASLPVPQDPRDDSPSGESDAARPAKAPRPRPAQPRPRDKVRVLKPVGDEGGTTRAGQDASTPPVPKPPVHKPPAARPAAPKSGSAKTAAKKKAAGPKKPPTAKPRPAKPRTVPLPDAVPPKPMDPGVVVPPKPPLPGATPEGDAQRQAPDAEGAPPAPAAADIAAVTGAVGDASHVDAEPQRTEAKAAEADAIVVGVDATVVGAEAKENEPEMVEPEPQLEVAAPDPERVAPAVAEPEPEAAEPEAAELEAVAPEAAVVEAEPEADVQSPEAVQAAVESQPETAETADAQAVVAESEPTEVPSDAVAAAGEAAASVPALAVHGLTKAFGGTVAVGGIDLEVPTGTFYGLVGPNGAGKTTTLSMIAGLLRPDHGTVRVAGVDAARQPREAKRLLGVLPDRLRTFDRLTGRQLLYYFGVLRGLDPAVVHTRTADLARAFDFADALARPVSDYSAGMTKKVMLAGAMIHSPRVLVLDEPFEAVDPVSSTVILDILGAYVDHGGTVILSSHGMELVERVCSRVAVIVGGHLLAEGPVDEVRGELTLEERFVQLAGGMGDAEGLEWLHTFSD